MVKAFILRTLFASLLLATVLTADQLKTFTFTEVDNNTKVVLSIGDTFVVRLKENVTTGFSWAVAQSDDKLIQKIEDKSLPPKDSLPGAAGLHIYRFRAVGPGQGLLLLHYRRPFEKGIEPAQTFRLQLSIRGPIAAK
jgi:inhibitor of cysteine peptidase